MIEHFGHVSMNGPATEPRDAAAENRQMNWKAIPIGCPAEIRAKILKRRQQILDGEIEVRGTYDEENWRAEAQRRLDAIL